MLSLDFLARVLSRGKEGYEFDEERLKPSKSNSFSGEFLVKVEYHYIELFRNLMLPIATYMEYFQRMTFLCIDVELAIDNLCAGSTANYMPSPPTAFLIKATADDEDGIM